MNAIMLSMWQWHVALDRAGLQCWTGYGYSGNMMLLTTYHKWSVTVTTRVSNE